MAENLTPKKYIDSNNMKQILTAVKSKTPVGNKYVTEEQLLAKDYATKTYVGEQIVNAEHLKREIVTVLPSDTEASDNVIYMLKVESATGNDKYQEYMKIDGTVRMIGDTSVDLTDYAKTADIPTTLPANGGNANTVNNHTVKSDVPENAVFTDTIYDDTALNAKLNGKADKNAVLNSLEIVNSYTTAQIIPWSDGTHYRSFEDKSNNTYTDIVTNNGIALITRTENGVMTKNAEIATMDKVERFSTTETPIGTWVDGKTIYRTYVSFPAFEMTPNEWNSVNSLSITDINEVINARAKRSEDNAIIPLAARTSGTSIEVNPSANFGISKLILEYTKQ